MTTNSPMHGWPVPTSAAPRGLPALAELWPAASGMPTRRMLARALASGLLAAVMVGAPPGLGLVIAAAATTAAFWPSRGQRRKPRLVGFTGLAWLLVLPVLWIDAPWVVALDLLAAATMFAVGLVPGSTWFTLLSAPAVWPLAVLRGGRWILSGVAGLLPVQRVRRGNLASWALSIVGTVGGLVVFVALFDSADPAFARLMTFAVPDVSVAMVPVRAFVLVGTALSVLAAVYVATAPPGLDTLHPRRQRAAETHEWLLPVIALLVLFSAFVVVQFTVLFAGDAHVLHTAGLTYADYAHQGFVQLVVVAALTLLVIGAVSRWAPQETATQRLLLRATLGLMCLLTLVIVASALRRLQLYDQVYGLTRLRMFAAVFAGWVGALFLLVLVAGWRLHASWMPHTAAASAGVALVLLTAGNPDAMIARSAIARFHHTGQLDLAYVSTLSADALPAVSTLPPGIRLCAERTMLPGPGDWRSINWSRSRARRLVGDPC